MAGATENQVKAHPRVLEAPFAAACTVVLTVGPLGPPAPEGCRRRSAAEVAQIYIKERGSEVLAVDGTVVPLTPEPQRVMCQDADQYSDMDLGVRPRAASLAIELS